MNDSDVAVFESLLRILFLLNSGCHGNKTENIENLTEYFCLKP